MILVRFGGCSVDVGGIGAGGDKAKDGGCFGQGVAVEAASFGVTAMVVLGGLGRRTHASKVSTLLGKSQ